MDRGIRTLPPANPRASSASPKPRRVVVVDSWNSSELAPPERDSKMGVPGRGQHPDAPGLDRDRSLKADLGRMDFSHQAPWAELGQLFGGDAFRFQFHLSPARAGWLEAGQPPRATLEQRAMLLTAARDRTLVWGDGADACWTALEPLLGDSLRDHAGDAAEPRERAAGVSQLWAPDFVLLRRVEEEFRFVAGSVCFPSAWDPVEKLGLTVTEVHGPVPGLNPELGVRIRRFLNGLRPGQVFERQNWSLAATGALDLHPGIPFPRIGRDTPLEAVWFRLEEQAFVSFDEGRSLLFLIHVRTWPLTEVLDATGAAEAFERMIRSMPPEVARYKGFGPWAERFRTGA